MLRTVLLSSLLLPILLPFGTLAAHNIFKRDAKEHAWNYESNAGPEHWPKMFKHCGGSRQSPVDIITSAVDVSDELDDFVFSPSYAKPMEGAMIENNGHTIVVKPSPKDEERMIDEGGSDDHYQFIQLHFHWGSDNKKGSEHLIDGVAAPLELHLVHRNKDYKTQEAALKKEGGLAVLGVLFEVSEKDNPNLFPIIDKLDDVRKEGTKADLDDSFDLMDLMPKNRMPYYRYDGSLTTPPCSEVVTWTIFKERLPISEKQLALFRNVKEEEEGEGEETLVNNFRPVQPLNVRVVHISKEKHEAKDDDDDDDDDDHCGGASIAAPAAMLAFSFIAYFL